MILPRPQVLLVSLAGLASAMAAEPPPQWLRNGRDALAAGLWEVAAQHFNEGLRRGDPSADRNQAIILLAEAWVRGGKSAEALSLLEQPAVASQPAAVFWRGQALAAAGRRAEAVAILKPLLEIPDAPHRVATAFTTASLQWALGSPADALATLARLDHPDNPALNAAVALRKAEILLEGNHVAEARAAMPDPATVAVPDRPWATFLDAHVLLAEGNTREAAGNFRSLIDQPQGQSLERHHAAALGLADAMKTFAPTEESIAFLLGFIDDHPDSPLLGGLFERLLAVLPQSPELTDPVLERLGQWIPASEVPASGIINTHGFSALSAWPAAGNPRELTAQALFARAVGLHRVNNPNARAEARHLLTRLLWEYPDHKLASRGLLESARWSIAQGDTRHAMRVLDILRQSGKPQTLSGRAAFLEARCAASQGDHRQALAWFDDAARLLAGPDADLARLNAGLLASLPPAADPPTSTPAPTTPENPAPAPPHDPALAVELQLERALAKPDPGGRRTAIEAFLAGHPDHPRAAEARIAAAEAALAPPAPDIAFARSQLAAATAGSNPPAAIHPARLGLLKLRIEDLAKETDAAIQTARRLVEEHPDDPVAAEAAFILGRQLFESRSYNEARIVLQKLAAAEGDSGRAQAAALLAARSAALVPTSQSQQEALQLFDKVIQSKGSLAAIAMLEKGRLMIDMNRLAEASTTLRAWFQSLPASDPLHLAAGLLLAEAIYAQGSVNPDSLTEALQVYDQLLVHAEQQPAVFNRLQYLRGRTLEQLPDPDQPSRKRDREAFIAFYSVLESPPPPGEWHYFELCGFRALALLEKAGRWPAAIACAKKIASFNGPRAEEAANRASQLQLTHMVWED